MASKNQIDHAIICLTVWIVDGLCNPVTEHDKARELFDKVEARIRTWPFIARHGSEIICDFGRLDNVRK